MSAPPFFTALGPGANPTWQRSTNSGATYVPNPVSPAAQINGGPTGQDRWRTTFTIDSGYSGTMKVTASGDIFDNTTNRAAILFYDGVAQGFVVDQTTGDLHGPRTFNIPVVPGVHTVELWIGQGGNPGSTIPVVTGNFSQSTLSSPCACCPLNISRCYLNENDNSIGTLVLLDCAGALKWIDTTTEAVVTAPKFCIQTPSDLTLNGEMVLPGVGGQQQSYSSLSTPPSSTDMAQTSPGVYQAAAAAVAACFGAHVANMTWTQRMNSLQLDYGANPTGGTSGALYSKFTSPATGPIGFSTFGNIRMQVGQSILSSVLSDGSYARLTYVKNSTGAPIPGTVNEPWIVLAGGCGFTLPLLVHDSTVTVERFTMKLDFFKP